MYIDAIDALQTSTTHDTLLFFSYIYDFTLLLFWELQLWFPLVFAPF